MAIKSRCTSCQRPLLINERLIGRAIPCPACGATFVAAPRVPLPVEVSPVAPADAGPSAVDTAAPIAQAIPGPESPAPSSVPPATAPAPALSRIGRFQVKAALGQGGFGTVYRAHDPILDREVALKVPRPSTKGAARLVREARAAASLRHPNIVAVYEAGADGDDLYIASEYVDGQTLADQARQRPVEPSAAAEWIKSLAEGLAYAHKEGVVHRDVKPQNIMIGTSGRAQLMDFGLAWSASDGEDEAGGISGTPAYMAPEQARGEADMLGPAADQYSLGAVLYELLTGQPPFDGGPKTVAQVAANARPPAPRSVRKSVPRDLEAICLKAMAPDPRQRYSDCRALAEDLGRWLNDELVEARNYSPLELLAYWARKRPAVLGWTAAAACLAALLLGGGAAYAVHKVTSARSPASAPTAVAAAVAVAPAPATSAAQVTTADRETETLLYGRLLDRTRLAYHQADVVRADHWLEQTRWDYRNWEYRYLRRIVTGGWKTLYAHRAEITALAVHPEGRHLASASADGSIAVWDLATGARLRRSSIPQRVTALAYSPNGKTLAVATGAAETQNARMGGPFAMPVPAPANSPAPTAAPQPPQAAPPPEQFAVLLLDANTLGALGEYREHAGPIASLAFSPDGRTIASGGAGASPTPAPGAPPSGVPQGEIRLWDAASRETSRTLSAPRGAVRRVVFLPDGQRIAAATGHGVFGQVAVWNLDPNATPRPANTTPLAPHGAQPVVAPVAVLAATPGSAVAAPAAVPAHVGPPSSPSAPQASAPTATSTATDSSSLLPEQEFSGGHAALAATEQPMVQLVAAPAMETWLLEAGRRRVMGRQGTLSQWMLGMAESPEPLSGLSGAVADLAAVEGVGSFAGSRMLAAAGGDALLSWRPGAVTLFGPPYDFGAVVPHLGHTAAVTVVAFRPDGKQFVSGSADGVIKFWNAEVHPEVVKLASPFVAKRVAFGKDGRYVVVAERSQSWTERRGAVSMRTMDGKPFVPNEKPRGSVKLYDIRNGRELLALHAGPGDVLALAVEPQLGWVAAGGEDAQVHVWDPASGRTRYDLPAPGTVRALAASVDGKYLAAACGGPAAPSSPAPSAEPDIGPGLVLSPGTTSRTRNAQRPVRLASYQPEGPTQDAPKSDPKSTSSETGMLVVWRMDDGSQVGSWKGHDGDALAVAFSPNAMQLASAGADRVVRLWNVVDQKEVRALEAYDGEVIDLAFRPNGNEIAGAGHDPCRPDQPGHALIWSVEDGKRRLTLGGRSGLIYGVTYSPDGNRLATGGGAWEGSLSRPGEVIVWDAETGIELLPLVGRPGRQAKTEGVPETEYAVVTDMVPENRQVEKIVDGKPVTETQTVHKPVTRRVPRTKMSSLRVEWEEPGTVLGVAFSGDGRCLAAACEDGSALVWDAEDCQPHDAVHWTSGRMLCAAASPDGKIIATAGSALDHCDGAGLIRLYDATNGRLTRQIEPPAGAVRQIALAPDGRRAVILAQGGPLASAHAPTGDVQALREDIQKLADSKSLPSPQHAELWDLTSGKRVAEVPLTDSMVERIAVHPIDGRVITASADGTIRVWDAEGSKEVHRWSGAGHVAALTISADGRRLAAAGQDGKLWRADVESAGELTLVSDQYAGAVSLAYDKTGDQLAVVLGEPSRTGADMGDGSDTTGGVLRISREAELGEPMTLASTPHAVALHDRGVAIGAVGTIAIVEPKSGELRLQLQQPLEAVGLVGLADGRLASVANGRRLNVWRVDEALSRTGACDECTPPHRKTIELERANPMAQQHKVRFSRDGKFAAVGAHVMRQRGPNVQHPVRTIDARTGESRHTGGHFDTVRSVAVRPDGKQFASVGQDKNLFFWNPGGSSRPSRPLPDKVMKVVYSRDGKTVATSTAFNGLVILFDSETGEELRRWQAEPVTAFALEFTPDGKQLVTAGLSGRIKVWDVKTGNPLRDWAAHEGTVQSIVFSHDGKLLASCGHDNRVKLWGFEKADVKHTLSGFAGPAWDCAFSPDDTLLAVGAHDPTVRIYNVDSGKVVKELPDHGQGVWSLSFSPDGTRLACCGRESPLVVWNWKSGERLARNAEAGECLAWWPDGTKLIAGSVFNAPAAQPKFDTTISLHDPGTGKIVDRIPFPEVVRPEFDISRDGRYVAVGRQDGLAHVWDRKANKITAECRGHQGAIRALAFDPRADRFATAGQDATVRIWSVDGKLVIVLPHSSPVTCLEFDPAGKLLATGDSGRSVQLWDTDPWPSASGDGSNKASGAGDKPKPIRTLAGHYGELRAVSFSGDGSSLAATSSTYFNDRWVGDLKVWDAATGKRTLAIPSHTWWEAGLAFHPTLPYVASTGKEHTLQVFHAQTGALLTSMPTSGYLPNSMAFSPDGDRLLTILQGSARLIDIVPEPRAFGNYPAAPAAQEPEDAAAAKWVLENGGRVTILVDGVAPLDVQRTTELPADPYLVRSVALSGNPKIGDADLAPLRPLKHLASVRLDLPKLTDGGVAFLGEMPIIEELFLNATQLTDAGLAPFAKLPRLRVLHANDTPISGPGLAQLSGCRVLENVELHRTKLDDTGLAALAKLPALKALGIAGTKVSDDAVKKLKAQKPELNIGR